MDITNLLEGDFATVADCENMRLMEHGFVKDTPIQIYKKLPEMTCVYIRGALIACRDYELAEVKLKDIER